MGRFYLGKKQETKPNETKEPEKKYLTKMEMNIKLTEYGKEIYKNEKYKIVEKKDGIYFLSLKLASAYCKEKLIYLFKFIGYSSSLSIGRISLYNFKPFS